MGNFKLPNYQLLNYLPMQEPSLLDYLKSLLDPRRPRIQIPWDDPNGEFPVSSSALETREWVEDDPFAFAEEEPDTLPEKAAAREIPAPAETGEPIPQVSAGPPEHVPPARWPWMSLGALALALVAQYSFEPPTRDWSPGVYLYLLSAVLAGVAYFRQEWQLVPLPRVRVERDTLFIRQTLLLAAGLLTAAAFYMFKGTFFTPLNVTLWLAALGCLVGALWLPVHAALQTPAQSIQRWGERARAWLANPRLEIRLTPWVLLVVGVAWLLFRSRAGLVLRAVGESPESAHALGIPVRLVRLAALLFGGACAGLAGAYLATVYTPLWAEGMTAGRGWIALALVVFATWRPARVLAGAYLFGGVTMLQLYLQGLGVQAPSQLMSMAPYLATIVVLALISRNPRWIRLNMPASLGRPFNPRA